MSPSIPKWMPDFFYRFNRGVYFEGKALVLLHSQITYMYKKRTSHAQLEISINVEYHRIVKVKAHTRFCNGKKVKVKTHYHRYQGIFVCEPRLA